MCLLFKDYGEGEYDDYDVWKGRVELWVKLYGKEYKYLGGEVFGESV